MLEDELGNDFSKSMKIEEILRKRPYYVVFALDKKLFDAVEILQDIMQLDFNAGISIITAFDDLPKECFKIFQLQSDGNNSVTFLRELDQGEIYFKMDRYEEKIANKVMKEISNISLGNESESAVLPKMVTFLEMFGVGKLEHLNILQRWKENNPVRSLATPIGVAPDGSPFMLDLHQQYHGPHVSGGYGCNVCASYDGTVLVAASPCDKNYGKTNGICTCGKGGSCLGNYVYILHNYKGNQFVSRYGHLQKVSVQTGQTVTKGMVIGEMGSTGASTGPHLDFTIWQGNSTSRPSSTSNQWIDPFLNQFLEKVANLTSIGCGDEYVNEVNQLYKDTEKPSNVVLALEKTTFLSTDHVTYYCAGNNVNYYVISIYDSTGKVLEMVKVNPGEYVTRYYNPGKYIAYCEGFNSIGNTFSNTIEFIVCNHLSTELKDHKPASCTAVGYSGDVYCKACKTKISSGKQIAKLDHTYDNGVISRPASSTVAGLKIYTCTVCKITKTVTIPATGIKTYSIIYHLNGGTNNTKNPKTYTSEQNALTILDPTKEHYTFNGWYLSETGNEKFVSGNTYNKDLDLYARWSPKTYQVTYNPNGGTLKGATVQSVTYGEKYGTLRSVEREGYTFLGWYTSLTGTTKVTENTICSGDIVLYAHWQKVEVPDAGDDKKDDTNKKDDVPGKDDSSGKDDTTNKDDEKENQTPVEKPHVHDYMLTKTIKATCLKNGKYVYTCICGAEKSLVISNEGMEHRWIEVIDKKATTTEKGIKHEECTVCGSKQKEYTLIDKLQVPKGSILVDKKVTYKVTSIGKVEYVKNTTNATNITVPNTVTIDGNIYKVTSIAANAFKNNKKLKKVVIGSNVTSIGKEAFSGCTKLASVTLGKNVTVIGDKAFYKCTDLAKLTIPAKVNKIGKQAFYGCKKLKSITIKTTKLTTKNVGTKAFQGIYAKATIKVPKQKLSAYKKMLNARGVGKKAKVKK